MINKGIMMNKRLERKDFDYSQVFDVAIESYREDTAKYLRQKKRILSVTK